ncbi:hypothetical protein AGMMS49938_01880 [Fibrobacterales bacterium]|nr:hypothetical protein AGMMS49938_01880 [Fibrobacterales bacterium]
MKTRFAPSPTGYLHKGHIWSALCVSAVAKARGASVHLRIEDHDRKRCTQHFTDTIKKDLEWLGFEWESESVQSERNDIYEAYLKILQDRGLLYKVISETLSHKTKSLSETTANLLTDNPKIIFASENINFPVKDIFNQWTYQFAVVVDDFEENIDLIVRGEDLKDSIEKQITLAKILGRSEMPEFIHHSLIFDKNGKKLSKRDGSTGICTLRENGISPKKVLGELLGTNTEISWAEGINFISSLSSIPRETTSITLPLHPNQVLMP